MELLTPNELSKILKLHPFTVERLAREGKLPAFKVRGSWRFRKDEFERWIASQTKKPIRSQRGVYAVRASRKNSNDAAIASSKTMLV